MVCRYIDGVRFRPPWGPDSPLPETSRELRQQDFQPLARLPLPPLQAFDAKSHLLQPLDLPERLGKIAAVAAQVHPLLTAQAVFGRGLEDLGDAVAGDRRAPA